MTQLKKSPMYGMFSTIYKINYIDQSIAINNEIFIFNNNKQNFDNKARVGWAFSAGVEGKFSELNQ